MLTTIITLFVLLIVYQIYITVMAIKGKLRGWKKSTLPAKPNMNYLSGR